MISAQKTLFAKFCKLVPSYLGSSGNTVVEQSSQNHKFERSHLAAVGTDSRKLQKSMTDYLCRLVLSYLSSSGNTVVEQSAQNYKFKHSHPATVGMEGGKWQKKYD